MNALSESLLGSFLALLGSVLKHFLVPGSTLGVLLAHFLNQKWALGSKGAPRGATPEIKSPFWRPLETCFSYFLHFFQTIAVLKYVPFFLRFLGRPERSTGWAHMQSVHAGAVQTHFFSFALFLKNSSLGSSFWVHLESNFLQKSQFWVKKRCSKNCFKKSDPPKSNTTLLTCREAPWQPPSRARFSEQETTVWARNKNRCSFLSPFLSPCPGMGYFWVHFWKIVHFLKESETKNK